MSTSTITKKALALAAAVGMSLGLSPLTVATASAATVNKTIKSSCRTNGAPMNFNQTRGKTDTMTVTAPRFREGRPGVRGTRRLQAGDDPR